MQWWDEADASDDTAAAADVAGVEEKGGDIGRSTTTQRRHTKKKKKKKTDGGHISSSRTGDTAVGSSAAVDDGSKLPAVASASSPPPPVDDAIACSSSGAGGLEGKKTKSVRFAKKEELNEASTQQEHEPTSSSPSLSSSRPNEVARGGCKNEEPSSSNSGSSNSSETRRGSQLSASERSSLIEWRARNHRSLGHAPPWKAPPIKNLNSSPPHSKEEATSVDHQRDEHRQEEDGQGDTTKMPALTAASASSEVTPSKDRANNRSRKSEKLPGHRDDPTATVISGYARRLRGSGEALLGRRDAERRQRLRELDRACAKSEAKVAALTGNSAADTQHLNSREEGEEEGVQPRHHDDSSRSRGVPQMKLSRAMQRMPEDKKKEPFHIPASHCSAALALASPPPRLAIAASSSGGQQAQLVAAALSSAAANSSNRRNPKRALGTIPRMTPRVLVREETERVAAAMRELRIEWRQEDNAKKKKKKEEEEQLMLLDQNGSTGQEGETPLLLADGGRSDQDNSRALVSAHDEQAPRAETSVDRYNHHGDAVVAGQRNERSSSVAAHHDGNKKQRKQSKTSSKTCWRSVPQLAEISQVSDVMCGPHMRFQTSFGNGASYWERINAFNAFHQKGDDNKRRRK